MLSKLKWKVNCDESLEHVDHRYKSSVNSDGYENKGEYFTFHILKVEERLDSEKKR